MPKLRLPLLIAVLALGGCRYTFVPLVPPLAQGNFPERFSGVGISRDGDDLLLTATLQDSRTRGYLSCVWYSGTQEIGRDSVYLDAQGRQARFRLSAPARGNYRAALSFEGTVLRQVEYSDPPQNQP